MLAAAVSRPLLSAAHSLTGRDSGVTLSSADCWVLGAHSSARQRPGMTWGVW